MYHVILIVVAAIVVWYFKGIFYNSVYLRYVAWILSKIEVGVDEGIKNEKKRIFQFVDDHRTKINGDLNILDVGSGVAPNLQYLPKDSRVVCLDPNPFLDKHADKNIRGERKMASVEMVHGFGEDLPFEADTFDVVMETLVFCTVADPTKCLKEIQRVLKPGGLFVFIEHVAAEKNSWTRLVQTFMNPVHRALFDGCCVNRETEKVILDIGMKDTHIERFTANYPFWFSPCIFGSASK